MDNYNRYKEIKKVGQGTYGAVFQSQDTLTKEMVAVKQIFIENNEEGIPSTAMREISLLKELDHPYIVKLRDVVCNENRLQLVFDYV
jgi:cyclin-dependent kinase 2